MMRRWAGYLRPEDVLSAPVLLISLSWTLLGALFRGPSTSAEGVFIRIVLVILLTGVLFGVLWLILTPVERVKLRPLPMAMVVVAAIYVASTARVALQASVLRWRGEEPPWTASLSAEAYALVIGSVVLVTTVAVGQLRSHLEAGAALQAQQGRLHFLCTEARDQLHRIDEKLISAVRGDLLAALRPLGTGTPDAVLQAIRSSIDDIVRPISRDLIDAEQGGITFTSTTDVPRLDWWGALTRAADPTFIRPWPVVGVMTFLMVPSLLITIGLTLGVASLVLVVVLLWGGLTVSRFLGERIVAGRSTVVRALVFILSLGALGSLITPGVGLLLQAVGAQPDTIGRWLAAGDGFRLAAPVTVVFVGYLVAVYSAARQQAYLLEDELKSTDLELRWELARLRDLNRQRRQALARILHGRVQATLTASYLRIEHESAGGRIPDELLSDVRSQVLASLDELGRDVEQPRDLDDLMALVCANWSGIAEICLQAPEDIVEALREDPVCAWSVNELLPELCFNAVRHAAADRVDISLRREDYRCLVLVVADNGGGVAAETGRAGLGSQLLEEACLWWRRSHAQGWTVTEACLPWRPPGESPSRLEVAELHASS